MKRILLIAMLSLSAIGLHAQSKTTGSVTLATGMTAKLDLNNDTSTATLTFTGPQDRWIGLQFGSFANGGGMQSGADLVYYNGTTLVDASHNGIGATPSVDAVNDWTVTSNTVSGSTRTIIATRSFAGGTGDYPFVYTDTSIDFAWAKGASASYVLSSHGTGNRGYQLNKTFSCMPPDAPTAVSQSFCSGATVADLAATGGTGATYKWYTVATGGTALTTGTALVTGTYYVSQTLSACESARTSVTVTVTNLAVPSATATQTFCNAGTVAGLTATGQTGATINWYTASAGGTALAGTTALATGTYYVGQTLGDCSSTRATVAVTVTVTAAPTAEPQTYCAGATVSDLVATGTAVKWHATQTGTVLSGTTALATGTYYATQTVSGCESTTTAVAITINPAPAAPTGTAAQTFTAGQTIADLEVTTATGATVTWYTLSGSTYTAVPTTTVLVTGTTYYVDQQVNGCESEKFAVTATLALGTATFNLSALKVYPNPVTDVVTIANEAQLSGVSVINMLGQEVITKKANGNTVQVNVSQLAGGTYILKVTAADGGSASVRIVKQ